MLDMKYQELKRWIKNLLSLSQYVEKRASESSVFAAVVEACGCASIPHSTSPPNPVKNAARHS